MDTAIGQGGAVVVCLFIDLCCLFFVFVVCSCFLQIGGVISGRSDGIVLGIFCC